MEFIELEFFHDKRTNMIVDESFWPILLARSRDGIY
jgi:hypothetical protein